MPTRQPRLPDQWLILDPEAGDAGLAAMRRLPPGSGVILLTDRVAPEARRIARRRRLTVIGGRNAERVHSSAEIRKARLRGARLILLSPVFPTRSHPDWVPLPRMRAASLARLAGRPLLALGGMNERRFRQLRRLGFDGWAGIDAWNARQSRE